MNFEASKLRPIGLNVAAVILMAALPVGVAWGRTWTVERDGSGDFMVIQDAVLASSPGDTILLGPGRFPEHAPFQLGVTNFDTYVGVDVDNLTIIGSGPGLSVVGPDTPNIVGLEPRGFAFGVGVTRLTIENLTIENVRDGIYAEGGSLHVNSSLIRKCRWGSILVNAVDSRISTSTIDSCETGISALRGSDGLVVSDLFVHGSDTAIVTQNAENVLFDVLEVSHTTIAVVVAGGSATIQNSSLITTGVTLVASDGSNVELIQSKLVSELKAIRISGQNSLLTGAANAIRGGTFSALHMEALGNAVISASDIVKGGGPAVFADGYQFEPTFNIDLRNNYWGTTEADSIAAWIIDGNDLHDPPLDPNYSNVLFEPFREQSIPTVKRSLGSLKASFGLREHKEPE
jgi:hypothetical protein